MIDSEDIYYHSRHIKCESKVIDTIVDCLTGHFKVTCYDDEDSYYIQFDNLTDWNKIVPILYLFGIDEYF